MKRFTKHLIVRYVISGGTSAVINLSTLSFLYYIKHMYYIYAAIIAFIVSFLVSLVLQKFWTFEDRSRNNLSVQIGKYLITSLLGLSLNTFILYVLVDHLHLYVYVGQIIAGGLVACVTFFISRKYVFKGQTVLVNLD